MKQFQPQCNKQPPYCKQNHYNLTGVMLSFGKWLFEKRKAAHLTQGQLAKRAGISTSYVSTIEREERHHLTNAPPQPTLDVVDAIAKALGEPIDEARIAAGYAPENLIPKPKNAAEFLTALSAMGLPNILPYTGIHDLTPDEYELLLRDVSMAVEMSLRRSGKTKE